MRFIKATDDDNLTLDLDTPARGGRFVKASKPSDADLDSFGGDWWEKQAAAERQRVRDIQNGVLTFE